MSHRKRRTLAAGVAVIALSGCASIFNGTTQTVTIQSIPDGAAVRVVNRAQETVHSGTTPVTVSLKRGAGYFKPEQYRVSFSKDGYAASDIAVDGTLSGWYVGNIVFGGLIGMLAVDPLTGAMYAFPSTISTTLDSTSPAPRASTTPVPTVATVAPAVPTVPAAPPSADAAPPSPPPVRQAAPPARPAEALGAGTSLHTVERLPETLACTASPRATLVSKGAGFEIYTVDCRSGDRLVVRCEFGNCRALR